VEVSDPANNLSYTCPVEAELCRSKCAGDEARVRISKAGRPVRIVQSQKHITDAVKLALVECCFRRFFTAALAKKVLPDKAITTISRTAVISSLARAASGEWRDLASYGKEVPEAHGGYLNTAPQRVLE
jgi:hypothetical protein